MTGEDSNGVSRQTEELLNEALRGDLSASDKARRKAAKRRWFGLGLMALSPFCLMVAVVTWPFASSYDKIMWLFYAFVLVAVGGWQLDLASKEAKDKMPPAKEFQKPEKKPLRIVR